MANTQISSIAYSGAGIASGSGNLKAGNVVTITVTFSGTEVVNTSGGSPTLTLNDGGVATFASASGTTVTFSYTVVDGQNTADLIVNAFDLNGATITNGGTAANVTTGLPYNPSGTLVIDTTVPSAPTGLDLAAADDTGSSSSDNITKNTTALTISGSGENGATVTLFDDANSNNIQDVGETALATATVSSGSFSGNISLAAGVHHVKAFQTDIAGNVSAASSALDITVDTTAPTTSFATVTLDLADVSDSGTSSTDNLTNVTTPTITVSSLAGKAMAVNDVIQIIDTSNGNAVVGSYVVQASDLTAGVWNGTTKDITLTSALATGAHALKVQLGDLAGNTPAAASTTALTVTIDTTAAAPTALDLTAAGDSGTSSSDNLTKTTSGLVITGSGETGATVTLYEDVNNNATQDVGEATLGSATVSGGAFTVNGVSLSGDGVHHVRATQTDLAGNVSASSTALDITIDTVAAAPVITGITTDTGTSSTDGITNDTTLVISGTAEANASVVVKDGATTVATVTANGSGAWSTSAITFAAGTHNLTATQTDSAGNVSSASTTFVAVVDTTAPAAPSAPDLTAASDSGSSNTDNTTNDTTPTFTGTGAEAGATVTLYDTNGTTVLGTGVADGSGNWSITSSTLSAGAHTLTVKQTDLAGNASVASAGLGVTIDTTAAAPTALDLTAAGDSGTSSTDNLTKTTSGLVITGSGETGATVTLYEDVNNNATQDVGEATLGSATVSGGAFTVNGVSLSGDGVHHVRATQTDLAGNVSASSTALDITIDTVAAAPSGLDLAAADDTGSSNSDNITKNTAALTISGSGENGATVTLFDDANSNNIQDVGETALATATVSSGSFSGNISLAAGVHHVKAFQTDIAGNVSAASSALDITVDTAATAPSAPDLTAASDSGSSNTDNTTNDTAPTFTGTGAEAGATVTLYDTNGTTVLGTGVADGSGNWSITSSTLSAGAHTLTVKQTDLAGNASVASAGLGVTIDTTAAAPTALDLTAAGDSGTSSSDNLTKTTSGLVITGSGETGATVTLYEDVNNNATQDVGEATLGSATVSGGAFTVNGVSLSGDGVHHVRATQTDLAGNVSASSTALDITIDTVAAAPVITGITTDTGTSSTDGITNDTTLVISGTAEANASVVVKDGATTVATVTANGSGAWSTSAITFAAGTHNLTATQTDSAGNVSSASTTFVAVVDTTAPAAPSAPDLTAASDSGSSNTDNTTNDTTPTFTGTGAEAGATVTLYDTNGTTVLGTGVADGSGNWSITSSTLSAGAHTLTVKQTDLAGNASVASAGLGVTIDTTAAAPTALDLTAAGDSGTSSTDNLTKTTSGLVITGSGETGATVTLYEDVNNNATQDVGEATLGSATVSGGAFTVNGVSLSGDGVHHVRATQTDLAGNVSASSTALDITIDTVAAAPSGLDLAAADDTGSSNSDNITKNTAALTISGSGENGATVTLFDDANSNNIQDVGETALATATVSSGSFSGNISLAAGVHHVKAFQTDIAGNVSAASSALDITVDTAATAPSAPDLTAASDSGSSNTDNTTNDTAPTFTGTGAEAGATVTLYDTNGTTVLGTGVADGSGNWSITSSTLSAGAHTLTVKQTDLAGNASVASAGLGVTIDTTAAAPTALDLTAAGDSGTSSSDNLTKTTSGLVITGSGETGATVTLYEDVNNNATQDVGEATLGSATVSGGAFTVNGVSLSGDGVHHVRATQTDLAGNVSANSTALDITIDTVAAAPVITGITTDTGTSSTDGITNDTTLVISGTAEANASVVVKDGATTVATVTANGSGAWSTSAITFAAGTHNLTATQTDSAGNVSSASTTFVAVVDTTAPASLASVTPDLKATSDSGSTNTDNITSIATPTVTVDLTGKTLVAGDFVEIIDTSNSNTVVGSYTVQPGDVGSLTNLDIALSELANGAHALKVRMTDVAGNVGAASTTAVTVTIDTSVAAPTGLDLAAADDTGPSNSDNITKNSTALTVSGSGESGATVTLFDDANSNNAKDVGEATLANVTVTSGSFSTDIALADGIHHVKAFQTDVAGNVSASSTALDITIDTVAAVPVITGISADSGTVGDHITNDTTLTISGTGEAGATVTVFRNGTSIGTATADVNSNWSRVDSTTLTNGTTYTYTASQVDVAGNSSPTSAGYTATIDTTAPTTSFATVTLDLADVSDSGTSSTDNLTNVTTPTITVSSLAGKAMAVNDVIQIIDTSNGNAVVGSYVVQASDLTAGVWNGTTKDITLTSALATGAHALKVQLGDLAGNTPAAASTTALTVTIDTTAAAPTALDLTAAGDSGTSSTDNLTKTTSGLVITGSGETGATVTLYEDVNNNATQDVGEATLGSATVSGGAFTVNGVSLSGDGVHHVRATQTDLAGNVSANSTALDITIDTVASASISVNNITADNILDAVEAASTVAVTGTVGGDVHDGDTVHLTVNGADYSGTVSSGTFNINVAGADLAADTNVHASVSTTDSAGNPASASSDHAYSVATAAPPTAVGTVTALSADNGAIGDFVTNVAVQTVSGTYTGALLAGEKIQVSVNGSSWIDAIASAGNWSASGVTLPSGSGLLQVRTINAADNTTPGNGHSFTLDTTNPHVTSLLISELSPTNASLVHYSITFSETVVGVDATQFNLIAAGVTGAHIVGVESVPGSNGTQYAITVNTGDGDGDIGLSFVGSNVRDIAGNAHTPTSTPTGFFQPQVPYAADTAPALAAIGDLNGDGKLDLAVSNIGSSNVSVLLGNGDGTFQNGVSYGTQSQPYSVAIGDLNGDGRPELITGNTGSLSISVLTNNGNGTFQTAVNYLTPDVPELVTVGDLNGDGKLDLVVPYLNLNALSVRLGNGNGTFASETLFATQSGPTSVTIADVNGDGKADLVSANWFANSLSVLLGNGNGTFQNQTSYAVGDKPITVAIGDVNGDSKLDLVVADSNSNAASLLLGNGDGTFQPQISLPLPGTAYAIALADLNGDGRLDIVAPIASANFVSVLFGNGDGTFQSQTSYLTQSFPHSVAVRDLNADGAPDIAIANLSSDSVSILLDGSPVVAGPIAAIDKTPPAAPIITTLVPQTTDATSIDLNGTAEANSTITLFNGVDVVGSTTADGSGGWHINNFTLTNGNDYNLTAKATDLAGNVSAASGALVFHDDQNAVPSPIITTTSLAQNNAALINIVGTAQANATITLYNFASVVGTTSSDTNGNWHVDSVALLDGDDYSFTATATNAANHTSGASNALTFHDDQTAPGAPTVVSVTENSNGGINSAEAVDGTPVVVNLAGTGAVSGDTLSVHWGSQTIDYALQQSDILAGNATVTVSAAAIAAQGDGTFDVTANLIDGANNVSLASSPTSVTVDTIAPVSSIPGSQTDLWTANNPAGAGNLIFGSSHGNAITVADNGSGDLSVALSVGAGNIFTLGSTSGVSVIAGANGTSSMTISGTAAQINAALENSTFHTLSTDAVAGNIDATVNIATTDATGNASTSSINIDVVSSLISFDWGATGASIPGITATSVTLAPAGTIEQNDLLIAFVATHGLTDPGAIAAPAGWVQLDNTLVSLDGTAEQFAIYYKVASAAESGGYSFSWSNLATYSWAFIDVAGVDPSHPIDASGGLTQGGAYSVNTIAPSVVTTGSFDALLSFWMTSGGTNPYSNDPTTTILANVNSTASDRPELMIAGELLTSSGPTQSNVMTSFFSSTDHRGFTVALNPVCFMAGTMIHTPAGEIAVETLKPGDLVVTSDHRTVPVRWLGRQTISTVFGDPLRVLPIRVKAGALEENVPSRDLLVSPDHALLVGGVLVHAGALVNGDTVTRETDVPETFTYFHVEVDDHSLILANSTPAETFIDNVDRLAFDNWDEHEALYPEGKIIEEMPYPRAKSHRQVPRVVRQQLAGRSVAVGSIAISTAA